MKKLFWVLVWFFLSLFVFSSVVKALGEQCRTQGGACRQGNPLTGGECQTGETSIGVFDCYQDPSGFTTEYCCIPGSPGCLTDGSRCTEAVECCSKICTRNPLRGVTYDTCETKREEVSQEGKSCIDCPFGMSYHPQTEDCCAQMAGICDSRYDHKPATFLDDKCGEGLSCSRKTGTCVKTEDLPLFGPIECYVSGTEWTDDTGWHPGAKGIQTALGCIPIEIKPLVSWLFKYAISIAGAIAFLMIIFSSFQMITSSGDPEKLQKAKQMLGSAIAGLLFIVFAVFLLQIIGADILKIF